MKVSTVREYRCDSGPVTMSSIGHPWDVSHRGALLCSRLNRKQFGQFKPGS